MSFNAMTAQEKPDRVIANDGFFPELSLRTFLDLYRLPGEYATDLRGRPPHAGRGLGKPPA